jgi:hypothetical protein
MGQRYLELEHTYTGYNNNTATLHVRQVPPNPAILVPGPAFVFVVVNGVPSVGAQVMIGSGELGKQETQTPADLPPSSFVNVASGTAHRSNSAALSANTAGSSAWSWTVCTCMAFLGGVLVGW